MTRGPVCLVRGWPRARQLCGEHGEPVWSAGARSTCSASTPVIQMYVQNLSLWEKWTPEMPSVCSTGRREVQSRILGGTCDAKRSINRNSASDPSSVRGALDSLGDFLAPLVPEPGEVQSAWWFQWLPPLVGKTVVRRFPLENAPWCLLSTLQLRDSRQPSSCFKM